MQQWNIRQYLRDAQMLIRENSIVVWWIVLLGLLSSVTLLLKETPLFWPLNVMVTVLSIVSTPVIYGIFFELIEDRYSSIPTIARTYVPGYIWLIIRMYLPPIFLASILISVLAGNIESFGGGGFLEVTLVLFSLLYLFVIPFYYSSGTGRGTILTGVSFLLKNLSAATPIIFAVLLLESTMLLLQYQRSVMAEAPSGLFIAFDFLIFLVASLIDYAIFIMLLLILKEHNSPIDQVS
jgi:hypothetical protein